VANESNPLIKAKRRAGRVKRWAKRKLWERNIGKDYKAWLAHAAEVVPGSTEHLTTISILVPVYNPPMAFLAKCLDSVIDQQARNWQLVIANDGSTNAEVREYLDAFVAKHEADTRITVLHVENGGISSAINHALGAATGEYIGMLDHDDVLDPRCIELFSEQLEHRGFPDAIYSDEDKINPRGEHYDLYCKPDYSPELLLTQMYLCHFTIFRRDLVVEAGGLRSSMDGAQDFDLALRLMPEFKSVAHIPLPLYHWRAWSESTALSIDAKPWAQEAAARAQQEHLDRTFGGGTVEPSKVRGLNEVHPRIMGAPRVSVIIPTIGTLNEHGNARFIDDCVQSLIEGETNTSLEIIIVTTGVIPDVRVRWHGEHTISHVVYDTQEFNFPEAINLGRTHASGEYLLLLNDDTTVAQPNPVTRMLEIGQIEGVGVTGCLLTYPEGRLQHVGVVLLPSGPTHAWIGKPAKEYGYFGSILTPRNYSSVTAAALLVRASVFDELGGFDTAFAKDFNDVDFCLRALSIGKRVAWTPYAHLTHHEGASLVRKRPDAGEQALFESRWAAKLAHDPYYSPALNDQLQRIYEPR
jgi:GT2 family glycosyltransferase